MIEGYVREATDDDVARARAEGRTPPAGFRFIVINELVQPHTRWKVIPRGSRRCRYGASRGHKACGAEAVVTLDRAGGGRKKVDPWGYCEQHLFGRSIEDGRLLAVRMVKEDANG